MARIRWVEEANASGDAASAYHDWFTDNPGRPVVPEILKCFSLRPDFFRQVVAFSNTVHFSEGHLSRRVKEMIATYVSALNQCLY